MEKRGGSGRFDGLRLITDLLPHQADAVSKLSKLKVGALYMEQGTGKTRTTLSLLAPRLAAGKVDCVLWLCPCSVKKNLREDLLFHCGEMPDRIIIRGIESLSSSDRLYMQLLRLMETHKVFLVVDESNLVKNRQAIRTSRIIELSKQCHYKLLLNGTPVSKNEADLFAQWYILDWRILGYQSYYSFAANHLEYHTIMLPNGREVVDRNRVKRVLNVDYLTEKIAPYTYQIKKDECLQLPQKEYRTRFFSLTGTQAMEYAKAKELYLQNVDEFRPETIYKLFTACQHVASGRRLLTGPAERMKTEAVFSDPEDNPRIEALFDEISALNDEKCIIFAKYQSEIDDIAKVMDRKGITYAMFTGKISQSERQESRKRFQNDDQFLLANKSCGAYGLNLQFCHNIIYYSNDFDLATRMQSEDRVHRIGQTETVRILDICASGTIDNFISQCLTRKERLVDAFKNELEKMKGELMKYGQINLGYSAKEKEAITEKYVAEHPEIKHIIVFYPDKWEHLSIEAEYIPYSEVIMYRTFYPLLEKIDPTYLLVYDECMRTRKRSDLTYNCMHKYNNQTDSILVFESFPFISDPEDFMILADLVDYVKMHGRHLDKSVFEDISVSGKDMGVELTKEDVVLPEDAADKYADKRQSLFDGLGNKDPDTVPNALEIFVGKWKKPEFDREYVARNKRYKADNVTTFAEARPRKEVCLIDLPMKKRDFSDYLKKSGCRRLTFLHTGLSIDNYLFDEYLKWLREVDVFYDEAGLH